VSALGFEKDTKRADTGPAPTVFFLFS